MLLVFTAPFFQGVLSLENKPGPCVLYSMHLCRTVYVVLFTILASKKNNIAQDLIV